MSRKTTQVMLSVKNNLPFICFTKIGRLFVEVSPRNFESIQFPLLTPSDEKIDYFDIKNESKLFSAIESAMVLNDICHNVVNIRRIWRMEKDWVDFEVTYNI
ncbi:TPA: hypothetical protein MO340_004236 [Salmonella enterica subsp. salamae serovar 35:g,m,s,t:-]|nr:hypothetical protein [Salmonella enterica subsp. salamae serovar 35:g,m,s,t:-]HCA3549708.1 hypothetical protein [Salmonella enterica subsp. salamae serovar 35:g,m,s,t:-]